MTQHFIQGTTRATPVQTLAGATREPVGRVAAQQRHRFVGLSRRTLLVDTGSCDVEAVLDIDGAQLVEIRLRALCQLEADDIAKLGEVGPRLETVASMLRIPRVLAWKFPCGPATLQLGVTPTAVLAGDRLTIDARVRTLRRRS